MSLNQEQIDKRAALLKRYDITDIQQGIEFVTTLMDDESTFRALLLSISQKALPDEPNLNKSVDTFIAVSPTHAQRNR